jgi:2'-5' RNA ligase
MNEPGAGTLHLNDEEFVEAFESCRLPAAQFHHADHIRLAWIYLRKMDEPEAVQRMAESIRRFAAQNGLPEKFHATMTRAWARLVAAARERTPHTTSFCEFAITHPHLLDKGSLLKHYSKDRLESAAARASWLEPDLVPLP